MKKCSVTREGSVFSRKKERKSDGILLNKINFKIIILFNDLFIKFIYFIYLYTVELR